MKICTPYLSAAIAVVVLFLLFPQAILHPNTFLFGGGGDGLKNATTFLYHLKFGDGLHYQGMNYPYGEHAAFADAQVALLWPLVKMAKVFPVIKNYGLAFLNFAMLLNIVLSAYIFCKIIRHYGTLNVLAVVGAIFITFFSPQIFRMFGHYALSYSALFGLAWWFLIQLQSGNRRFALYISILLFIGGLLHFYHAVIIGMFLLCAFLLKSVATSIRKEFLFGMLATVAGIAAVLLFNKITDTIIDRPNNPWGFFACNAYIRSVFLPHPNDLLAFGDMKHDLRGFSEGFAYIGVIGLLFTSICLIRFFRFGIKKQLDYTNFDVPVILASVIVLLFSMNFPWVLGLEFVVDYVPFLKQFRSTGRFAWVFFYVVNVFAFVNLNSIWNYLSTKHKAWQALSILIALLACSEFSHRLWRIHGEYKNQIYSYNMFLGSEAIKGVHSNKVHPKDYQAILVLPFFHVGSEKFGIEDGASIYEGLRNSLLNQLPLINVMMSRTSLSQSLKTVQLLSENASNKLWLNDVKDDRPILLLHANKTLEPQQNKLLQYATLIDSAQNVTWYSLPISAFRQMQLQTDSLAELSMKFYRASNYMSEEKSDFIKVYFPQAKQLGRDLQEQRFAISDKDSIEIGAWIKCRPHDQALPSLQVHTLNAKGEWLANTDALARNSTEVFTNTSWNGRATIAAQDTYAWILVRAILAPKENAAQLKLYFTNDVECSSIYVRPINKNFTYEFDGWLYYNGLPVKQKV
jgi:hypothetical protein